MNRRAFTIAELMIALLVASFGIISLITVFRSTYQHSTQSRNRTIACIIAQSLMDEVEEHPWGLPAPASWSVVDERPASVWIEGRHQEMVFHKKIEFETGSLVGKAATTTDMVTITLSWHEAVGQNQNAPGDNRQMVVKVPVWQ